MRWPWRRRERGGHSEARSQLAKLDARDAEVAELRQRLDRAQQRNNFSGMVTAALHRAGGR